MMKCQSRKMKHKYPLYVILWKERKVTYSLSRMDLQNNLSKQKVAKDNYYTSQPSAAGRIERVPQDRERIMDPVTHSNPSYRARTTQDLPEQNYSYPFYEMDLPPTPRNGHARRQQFVDSSDSFESFPRNPYATMTDTIPSTNPSVVQPTLTVKKSNYRYTVVGTVITIALVTSIVAVVIAAVNISENQRLKTRLEKLETVRPSSSVGTSGLNCTEETQRCRAPPLQSASYRQPCTTPPLSVNVPDYFTTGMRCEYESVKIGTVESSHMIRIGDEVRCQCDVLDVDMNTGNHIALSFGVEIICRLIVSRCRIN